MINIAIQSFLRPALTAVPHCQDYAVFRDTLERIDRLLMDSSLERQAIEMALEDFAQASVKQQHNRAQMAIRALRMEVLRFLLGGISFRHLARSLGSSDLLADFCRVRDLRGIRGISKSNLDRYSKLFTEEQLRQLHETLSEVVGNEDLAMEVGLEKPLDMGICLIDSTCLEANIHWPTDWVLLKDVAATLLQAIKLIRETGLRHRMPQGPEHYARQMNRLCIAMTHSRRRRHSGKERKKILRKMKRLLKTVGGHAQRHRDLLASSGERTAYSCREIEGIIARIDRMRGQIPEVIRQAHERIIGERQVANADKILSVHEPDAHVIVRGKAGKEVEFGNTLLVCESREGYLLDWKLYREQAPSAYEQMKQSLQRQGSLDVEQALGALSADRGFASRASSAHLQRLGIYDGVAPKDPGAMKERMSEEFFGWLQRRRGGLEGRIATVKNRYHSGRLRAKGFTNRNLATGWSVLSHNLWLIAKTLALEAQQRQSQAA